VVTLVGQEPSAPIPLSGGTSSPRSSEPGERSKGAPDREPVQKNCAVIEFIGDEAESLERFIADLLKVDRSLGSAKPDYGAADLSFGSAKTTIAGTPQSARASCQQRLDETGRRLAAGHAAMANSQATKHNSCRNARRYYDRALELGESEASMGDYVRLCKKPGGSSGASSLQKQGSTGKNNKQKGRKGDGPAEGDNKPKDVTSGDDKPRDDVTNGDSGDSVSEGE